MIELINVCKKFEEKVIFEDLSLQIPDEGVVGIMGQNGCGKTVTARIMAGIYNVDSGQVLMDGKKIYENFNSKYNMVFLSEEPYIEKGMSLDKLARTYRNIYDFDIEYFEELKGEFSFTGKEKLNNESGGKAILMYMLVILACKCRYCIIDESLDKLSGGFRAEIMNLIKKDVRDKNKAFVIITENDDMVEKFDHVIDLDVKLQEEKS